jgi:imidazolonepropionase-like amidohydrolase/Tol biopolymer transport system component
MSRIFYWLLIFSCCLNINAQNDLENSVREVGLANFSIEVKEVTTPDISVAPDGKTMVFTIIGHLFKLPIEGGKAEQLTFGPNYNRKPSFSPDGNKIAFVSDIDGSEGNIFILNLATKEISQVTHSLYAGYPSWSPDGENILFLEYEDGPRRACPGLSIVKSINLLNHSISALTSEYKEITSTFYAQDSKPGWSVIYERGYDENLEHEIYETGILIKNNNGTIDTVKTIKWCREGVSVDPNGNGFYTIKRIPGNTKSSIVYCPADSSSVVPFIEVLMGSCTSKIDRMPDGNDVIAGFDGGLWMVSKEDGAKQSIPFTAHINLKVNPLISPIKFNIDEGNEVSMILSPQLSNNGQFMIFGAMGHLWKKDLITGKSKQLTSGIGLYRKHALSPDGKLLAYVKGLHHEPQIRLLNISSGEESLITSGSYFWDLTWNQKTNHLYWAKGDWDGIHIYSWDYSSNTIETILTSVSNQFPPRPHFSGDGHSLFYRQDSSNTAFIKRFDLDENKTQKTVATVANNISNVLISPNEKWIAFRRNSELWLRSFDQKNFANQPVSEKSAKLISPFGGRSFSFTGDGSGIIYSEKNKVFLYLLAANKSKEISVRLNVKNPVQKPILLQNVHLLNNEIGAFSKSTDLLIKNNRISRIGSDEFNLPKDVEIIDAKGRFVIPGLIDSHIHVEAPWWYQDVDQTAYIAYGVTTVRDMGESLSWVKSLADRSKLTNTPIPRYAYSGNLFQGKYKNLMDSFTFIQSKSQVQPEIKRHYELGTQFIKSYADLSWDLHLEIVKEARKLSLPIAAHGANVKEIARGVTQGYSFLEHLEWLSPYFEDIYKLLAKSGVYWTPTLNIMGGNIYLLLSEKERFQDKKFCAFFPGSCKQNRWATKSSFFKGLQSIELRTLSNAREKDVSVLMGTDTPYSPGASMHTEMELYTMAGYSPFEAINIATYKNAKALGIDHDLGTIKIGKLADLIILDENPLIDIRNTHKIWRVIKGGEVFNPTKLTPK